jgi:type II secretory pathway component PulF
MATFVYEAVDPSGKSINGKVEADSEATLVTKLHEQHFHVVAIKEAGAGVKAAVVAAVAGHFFAAVRDYDRCGNQYC